MDWRAWLRVAHFGECLSDGDSSGRIEEECSQFGFSGGCHDILDYLGDVENGVTLNDILQSFPAKESSSSNLIVMVKDKTDAKLGNEFLLQLAGEDSVRSQIPIVACQWLLDSIGDFELQKTDDTKYKMKSE